MAKSQKKQEADAAAAQKLADDLQSLRARYAIYEDEYNRVKKIKDLGSRYVAMKACADDIEEDVQSVRDELFDNAKFKKFKKLSICGLGASIGGMVGSFSLLDLGSAASWIAACTSIVGGITMHISNEVAMNKVQEKAQLGRQQRLGFLSTSDNLAERIRNEANLLPVNQPHQFAKSRIFDDIMRKEPALLESFNREALRERIQRITRKPAPDQPENGFQL